MATKSQLVSDIILRITKGKPSDDLELEPKQVAFWIDLVLNSAVKEILDEQLKAKNEIIDPGYIKVERGVEAKIDSNNTIYFSLCDEPINLHRDAGVMRIATSDGDGVDKMKMEEIDDIENLKFSRPSVKNIKYTRVRSTIYLYGLTADTMNLVTYFIAYIPKLKLLEGLDDNDEINVGDNVLDKVAEEVEKIARRQMFNSPEDLANNAQQNLDTKE